MHLKIKMEDDQRTEQLKKATDRIQREIEEVTEREHELRSVGSTSSDESADFNKTTVTLGTLKRTTSNPHILEQPSPTESTLNLASKMTNGGASTRATAPAMRFATAVSQKGLMKKFLATRGKIYGSSAQTGDIQSLPAAPRIVLNPLSIQALSRTLSVSSQRDEEPKKPPERKGYIPVEQKIQKELTEMKEREMELRLMRSQMLAKSSPNLLDIGNDHEIDIYDGSNSIKSGTSSNTLNDDEPEGQFRGKPNPKRRSILIAQWESLIAAKKDANGEENGDNSYIQD